jgi:hypothetical protein
MRQQVGNERVLDGLLGIVLLTKHTLSFTVETC